MLGVAGAQSPARGVQALPESRWPVSLAAIAAIVLYGTLPERYTLGPRWLFPALELAVLVVLWFAGPRRNAPETAAHRSASAAMQIWLTNVIVFGLWYWELDRGGPTGRHITLPG